MTDENPLVGSPLVPTPHLRLTAKNLFDLTMAYVGTRGMFEEAGFEWAADSSSVLNGFPRIVMRRRLT